MKLFIAQRKNAVFKGHLKYLHVTELPLNLLSNVSLTWSVVTLTMQVIILLYLRSA